MNYEDLGYDSKLRKIGSPAARPLRPTGLQFDYQNPQIQASRMSMSKLNVTNLVQLSEVGTAVGAFSSSQSLSVTTVLSYISPHANDRIFGQLYMAFYQGAGTASADQIYPIKGANVTAGRYDVQGMYDIVGWNGTQSRWRGLITDTNGTSSQQITFQTQWWHIDNVSNERS